MKELRFSKRLSIGLFSIGTLIFVLYAITLSTSIGLLGYIYVGLAAFIGIIYLLTVVIKMIRYRLEFMVGLKSAGIMILNIPVVLIYFYLVMILMNTARITLENSTGQDISSIRITGCDHREIETLKAGKLETIWINIPGDCALEIEYQIEGKMVKETVAGYLTSPAGIIATYKIGSNKDILLQTTF